MVVQPMAFNSIESSAQDEERLINDILQKIQQSSKETCLWEKTTVTTIKSPKVQLSEKRADFIRNTQPCGDNKMDNGDKDDVFEEVDKKEYIDLWDCISYLDNESSVDENNNTDLSNVVHAPSSSQVCTEPNTRICPGLYKEDIEVNNKCKRTKLVRRQSSVDSGIVVRTPSEKIQDRERRLLMTITSPAKRCETSDITDDKARVTPLPIHRSNSLPNLGDLDLDKFKTIRFKDVKKKRTECVIVKATSDNGLIAKERSDSRSKHKDLFNIRNYMTGKYRKTKLSEYIKRNNTFSLGEARVQSSRKNIGKCLPSTIEENENYVLSFDIDSTDQKGDTCLHYASSKGDIDTVKYLLKQGGNVWRKNKSQQVPMDVSKDFKTAKLLSHATIFYSEPEQVKQSCNNISSTVKLSIEL